MRNLFLLIVMIYAFQASATTPAWKLKNNFTVSKVWQNVTDQKLYVSTEKTKLEDAKNFRDILKNQTQLKEFEEEKKKLLSLIGVTKWNASSKEWVKVNGRDFLKIQGTYIDNSEEIVYFKEFHLVEGNDVLQVLFTSTNQASYTSQADIEEFLKDIKMDVVSE